MVQLIPLDNFKPKPPRTTHMKHAYSFALLAEDLKPTEHASIKDALFEAIIHSTKSLEPSWINATRDDGAKFSDAATVAIDWVALDQGLVKIIIRFSEYFLCEFCYRIEEFCIGNTDHESHEFTPKRKYS